MRWPRLRGKKAIVGAAVGAIVCGAVAGWLSTLRGDPTKRPAEVEAFLRAVENTSAPAEARRAAIARAKASAGEPGSYDTPWREDVEFARLAAVDDFDGLYAFATTGPPVAGRARALVWISDNGRTPKERARALERLRADYPDSWVVKAVGR
jgi:hypothetical protein